MIETTAFQRGRTGRRSTRMKSLGFTTRFVHGQVQRRGTVHFIRGLAEFSQQTYAVDVGTLYDVGAMGMRIGMAISNIGSQITFIQKEGRIPGVFRVGTSLNLLQRGDQKLLGSFEFSHPPDNAERMNVGAEYSFQKFAFLRGGYSPNYDAGDRSWRGVPHPGVGGGPGGRGRSDAPNDRGCPSRLRPLLFDLRPAEGLPESDLPGCAPCPGRAWRCGARRVPAGGVATVAGARTEARNGRCGGAGSDRLRRGRRLVPDSAGTVLEVYVLWRRRAGGPPAGPVGWLFSALVTLRNGFGRVEHKLDQAFVASGDTAGGFGKVLILPSAPLPASIACSSR